MIFMEVNGPIFTLAVRCQRGGGDKAPPPGYNLEDRNMFKWVKFCVQLYFRIEHLGQKSPKQHLT